MSGEEAAHARTVVSSEIDQAPHDRPTAAELLQAVEDFLREEILPAHDGRSAFHLRVAANVLAVVRRQLALGPDQRAAHAARLRRLDMESDAQLAAAIRSGALDDRYEEVLSVVRDSVADKLAVANPAYLAQD